MRTELLDILMGDPRIAALLRDGQRLAWERQIASDEGVSPDDWGMLCRAALLLSNAALVSPLDDVDYAKESYQLLSCYPILDSAARHIFESTAGYDLKDESLLYYFYLASLALKLNKTITARLVLKTYDAAAHYEEEEWGQRTLYKVLIQLPDIEINHRRPHGGNGASYLPIHCDAAVGNPELNLIFTNRYDFPIRIVGTSNDDGALLMRIYRYHEEEAADADEA